MNGEGTGRLESVENPPFSQELEWRVYSETYIPALPGETIVIAAGMVTGEIPFTSRPGETLTLSATVRGRERVRDIVATPAILDSVSVGHTYKTSAHGFPWRCVGWSVLWVAAYVLAWPFVLDTLIMFFIAVFAITFITPLIVARAITDFAWWAGHGFRAVRRTRWIIAGVLWVLALGPLILLQVLVLQPRG